MQLSIGPGSKGWLRRALPKPCPSCPAAHLPGRACSAQDHKKCISRAQRPCCCKDTWPAHKHQCQAPALSQGSLSLKTQVLRQKQAWRAVNRFRKTAKSPVAAAGSASQNAHWKCRRRQPAKGIQTAVKQAQQWLACGMDATRNAPSLVLPAALRPAQATVAWAFSSTG